MGYNITGDFSIFGISTVYGEPNAVYPIWGVFLAILITLMDDVVTRYRIVLGPVWQMGLPIRNRRVFQNGGQHIFYNKILVTTTYVGAK